MYILTTNIGDQLGNDLGVGLGLKHEALGHQELLDVLVVGDDAIVDHDELVVVSRHQVTRLVLLNNILSITNIYTCYRAFIN